MHFFDSHCCLYGHLMYPTCSCLSMIYGIRISGDFNQPDNVCLQSEWYFAAQWRFVWLYKCVWVICSNCTQPHQRKSAIKLLWFYFCCSLSNLIVAARFVAGSGETEANGRSYLSQTKVALALSSYTIYLIWFSMDEYSWNTPLQQ